MTGRVASTRAEAGYSLPAFERLAPAPSAALLAARIEAHTGPGDVVVDLAGRGGWVARAALDRQRRAVSIESTPLTRMLAEVVLRPPDVRHLDAAFQGMSASPRRETSLKVSIGDLFATRCATCGRMLVADEFTWSAEDDGTARAVLRHYRCTVCRDQRGGSEQRQAPLEPDDVARAMADADLEAARAWARDRFPVVERAPSLVDEIRRRSGLSQAELARRAGLPRSVINTYVRGRRQPGADALARIAAAGGLELQLVPRTAPVDAQRAGRLLVQVLELAEALPFRPRKTLEYPKLPNATMAR